MSEVIRIEQASGLGGGLRAVEPRLDIRIRRAVQDDFAFIDALQKADSDKVGFQYEQAIRKRIEQGNVLVAVATSTVNSSQSSVNKGEGTGNEDSTVHSSLFTDHSDGNPVGYCLGVDRYMKQDHVGIIYQMCVAPAYRRSLVAAALLQAQFDQSAYGTKLYCCWCKQSLEANRFWEAMGFVPLAFRAAGRSTLEKLKKKHGNTAGGVHVFW
ncbi:GNAT family N-acetyltransferase [Algisphaera agarilytica]|uniref:Ribosomal protein S18 acetylase RimI-like enzyme n=1 Tax=Algisphaera agarilytica TaxID=1385975 RepID=A0A7X0LL89_9BACT|nr:GNAT family N-acetyltransferase [Algisphaera agarilytica]MBB6429738.1 ribosomal protein S18 acetylase RimI-like enzyme [Algisphaera agarilytica]